MGNENSQITKEDLIEIQKKQLILEEQNKKIQQDLLKQKKINDKLKKVNKQKPKENLISMKLNDKDLTIDPFKLFSISPDTSIEEIKSIYKKLLVKYHPDKSGYDSTEEYKFIQKAFQDILKIKLKQDRTEHSLNRNKEQLYDERNDLDEHLNRYNYHMEPTQGSNFNNSKFNQMFDTHKYVDTNQTKGYSEWLKDDTNFDKNIPNISSKEKLNSVFDEYIQKMAETKQIVEYIDPENEICTTADYDLLVSDIDDFTKHGQYTDLKKAYTEKNILHPGQVKSRETYSTIEQVKSSRSAPITLSKEEQIYLENKKNLEIEKENQRLEKLKYKDVDIEKFYTNLHGRAIELPSYRK